MWRNHCVIEKAFNGYCVHAEQLGNGVMARSRLGQPQRVNREHWLALDFPAGQKNGRAALYTQSAAVASLNQAFLRGNPPPTGGGLPAGQALRE
ncbi:MULTISPECIES: hypothetical protein [Pseudomonas]|uniref:hypothetical protein n=1 Tax=Pseudomonas TaxID=286 RepID=UPI0007B3888A|nr:MULTISPECIES: hypothetical protein [Pseudomonas]KZO49346.1 hypothetical protein PCL1391_2301 [Pseudomonas chlororaphis subsp. piscium]PMY41568.1 hypothetical protein C1Y36_21235 [Pseudomonas sp. FW306-2-2C-D06C]PYC38031.1 hypothetical protein DMW99_10910 [Pseudomonas chlororaphis]